MSSNAHPWLAVGLNWHLPTQISSIEAVVSFLRWKGTLAAAEYHPSRSATVSLNIYPEILKGAHERMDVIEVIFQSTDDGVSLAWRQHDYSGDKFLKHLGLSFFPHQFIRWILHSFAWRDQQIAMVGFALLIYHQRKNQLIVTHHIYCHRIDHASDIGPRIGDGAFLQRLP